MNRAGICLLALFFTVWSGSCIAQALDDKLLRAAYCFGVFRKIRQVQQLQGTRALTPNELQLLDEKAKRYARYLVVMMPGHPTEDQKTMVTGATTSGEWDATKLGTQSPIALQCRNEICSPSSDYNYAECVVDCLAAHGEQTEANVWRCVVLPDDLPF